MMEGAEFGPSGFTWPLPTTHAGAAQREGRCFSVRSHKDVGMMEGRLSAFVVRADTPSARDARSRPAPASDPADALQGG